MVVYPVLFSFARLFPLQQSVSLSVCLSFSHTLTQAHGHTDAHGSLIHLKKKTSYILMNQWTDGPTNQTTY